MVAVVGVLLSLWVSRQTLVRHDKALRAHWDIEGTALCISYREQVLRLHHDWGLSAESIRELLNLEEDQDLRDDGLLEIEHGCAPIDDIIARSRRGR